MLGKILLTLTVIGIAYLVIRQRQVAEAAATSKASAKGKANQSRTSTSTSTKLSQDKQAAKPSGLSQDLRIASYLFLIFMVGIGAALYYYRWQDDHQVITVNLLRADQDTPVSYQVYKFQLGERTFTTVDGRQVTVASSERMEIIGLND